MKYSPHLMLPLFTLSLLSAWADPSDTSEQPTRSVGYKPDPVTTQPKGIITPTVSPRVDKGFDINIDAAFIWWKTYVSDFDYAQIDGRILTPQFNFEPGVKVGTGMDLMHDGWDAYSQYTWLHQPELTNSKSTTTSGYSTLIIPFGVNPTDGVLTALSLLDAGSWRKFTFNILDIEAGRNFFISQRLTLRPHIGLKGASLFEKTKVIYISDGSIETSTVHHKQNLSGLGIRGGLNTVWHIIPSFGFYGDLALTALWGSFHNTFRNEMTFSDDSTLTYSLYSNAQDILPVFEAGLGVTYMVWFKESRYQFFTKLGWEEQIWLGYNKNIVNGQTSADGSLTIQGLTWKAGFIF